MSTAKPTQTGNVLATDRSLRYSFRPEDREAIAHCIEHYDDLQADLQQALQVAVPVAV